MYIDMYIYHSKSHLKYSLEVFTKVCPTGTTAASLNLSLTAIDTSPQRSDNWWKIVPKVCSIVNLGAQFQPSKD